MNPSYFLGWCATRAVLTGYFGWRAFNPERVPASGPVILASNHTSLIDPPLVGAGLRREIAYLARESLFRFPPFAMVLRSWHVVPVNREGAGGPGLKAILDRLLAGDGILLFPEGTRSATGALQPARAGIGLTVIKSNAPVVPVRVFGTFDAWGRQSRWPKPRRVAVKYGVPQTYAALRSEARDCSRPRLKAIYQEIADDLMARIAALGPYRDKDRFP